VDSTVAFEVSHGYVVLSVWVLTDQLGRNRRLSFDAVEPEAVIRQPTRAQKSRIEAS
jgi:hypothetical protein